MDTNALLALAATTPSAIAAAAFVWVAQEIKYIRRDLDNAHKRINERLDK